MLRFVIIGLTVIMLAGCATMPSTDKTVMLHKGMSSAEVIEVLGTPHQTESVGNRLVWKYDMYSFQAGVVPYYLVFDQSGEGLDSWYMDKDEYIRNREYMLRASPPEEKKSIELSVKQQ